MTAFGIGDAQFSSIQASVILLKALPDRLTNPEFSFHVLRYACQEAIDLVLDIFFEGCAPPSTHLLNLVVEVACGPARWHCHCRGREWN